MGQKKRSTFRCTECGRELPRSLLARSGSHWAYCKKCVAVYKRHRQLDDEVREIGAPNYGSPKRSQTTHYHFRDVGKPGNE